MVYPRQSIHRNSLKYPFQMSTWTFIKCFSISFVVYHRTKSLSFEKFTNICVFGEIIPFLSHLCLSFALHAISAVLKLLTSSYKLSASLQDLFPYCTLKLCHVLSSIAIRLRLVDVASFPSVLNLKLPTEKGGWCMFLFQTICLWWMSKVPALSAFIFNVWLSFVVLVRSVYLLFNLVSQPEGCHGSIKCHHLSPRQVFPSAMVWLFTRLWQCLTSSALFATIGSHMHNGHI